jgi:DNA-binding transcriptional ArsR family regulator
MAQMFTCNRICVIFISTDIEILNSRKGGMIAMTEETVEVRQAVKVYKALGEPTRLKIAMMLTEESNLCCSDIGSKLESVAGSTLSHHLKQLTDCGLLNLRKDGTYIYYSVNREMARKYAPYLLT